LRLRDAEAFGESNGENVDDSSAPQKKKGIRDTLSGEGNLTFYEESVNTWHIDASVFLCNLCLSSVQYFFLESL
jgi:hypothetical protein